MYENVFSDVRNRSDIAVYENKFKEVTNEDYKLVLYDLYINKDMTPNEIAKLFGTTKGVIDTHKRKYGYKKEQVINTDNVMYKTPSIIEKETGRKFIDIYNELAGQGLSLTEITIKLNIGRVGTVSTYLNTYKRKQENLLHPINENELIVKGLKGRNPDTVERMFREQLGIEYKDFLEQKYINEGMSQPELSNILGISTKAISRAIVKYGLHKTQSQSRKEAIEKGIINYDKILSKSRKTRNKSKSLSHKQDLLITLLKYNLEKIFNESENIEIIVGYNEYCILGSLEIDIPIIIIKNNQIHKIALEYDGDVWHENRETDNKKEKLLIQKKWYLIRIEETHSESPDLGLLEDKAKNIVNKINEYIN